MSSPSLNNDLIADIYFSKSRNSLPYTSSVSNIKKKVIRSNLKLTSE